MIVARRRRPRAGERLRLQPPSWVPVLSPEQVAAAVGAVDPVVAARHLVQLARSAARPSCQALARLAVPRALSTNLPASARGLDFTFPDPGMVQFYSLRGLRSLGILLQS